MTVKTVCSPLRGAKLASLYVPLVASLAFAGAVTLVTWAPHSAYAQDAPASTGALMDRLDRLERDIRTLNQQIARGAAPAASSGSAASSVTAGAPIEFTEGEGVASRMMVRLSALESEVRSATGQSEDLSYRIDQLAQRLDKLMVDIDYRLARLEGANTGGSGGQPMASPAPATVGVSKVGAMPPVGQSASEQDATLQGTMSKDGTYKPTADEVNTLGQMSKTKLDAIVSKDSVETAAPAGASPAAAGQGQTPAAAGQGEGTVEEQYRFAFDLTRQARYDEAETAFKAFLGAHGDDDLANNARYWLAETYYVRKRYTESAQAFFEAYQKAPKGPKAPDALLKLGMAMAALDKPTEACATFGKLRKEFTPLKSNIEQALSREIKRLECK